MKKLLSFASTGLLCALAGTAAHGGDAARFPERAIRIVVPLASGSTVDTVARMIGAELSTRLGQPVVIDNKPSAGGSIAMAEVARSAADGYTIAFASQGNLIFNLSLYGKPGYSTSDFAPISLIGSSANLLVVSPGSPYKSVSEFVAGAKAKQAGLTFSSGGSGTSQHLSGALFNTLAGTHMLHVPYRGAPAGIVAVMSGEVDAGFYNTPTVLTLIQQRKLRALAVTSAVRSPLVPDVPTLEESGLKGYEMSTWYGFVAPAATPKSIIARYQAALAEIMGLPPMQEKMKNLDVTLAAVFTDAPFSQLLGADLKKWAPIIKASGATVD